MGQTRCINREFAKVRKSDNWRALEEDGVYKAYLEFRDFGPRGNNAFLEDAKVAISNQAFGPSWKKFIDCLVRGSIFAIITARGHEPDSIRRGVEYIIWNVLTNEQRTEMGANLTGFQDLFIPNFDIMRDVSLQTLVSAYLDKCDFVGVNAPSFIKKFSDVDVKSPEEGKKFALDEFVARIKTYGDMVNGDVSIGFSDDDTATIDKVEKHFNEISKIYDDISFNIINTSDPNVEGGIKKKI